MVNFCQYAKHDFFLRKTKKKTLVNCPQVSLQNVKKQLPLTKLEDLDT